MTTRLSRKHDESDSYMEDRGCHLHDRCLTCPLPNCYLDRLPGDTEHSRSRRERREAIYRSVSRGMSVRKAVKKYGVSERTVHRAIEAKGKLLYKHEPPADDIPGKPVSEISHGIKERKPPPVMQENADPLCLTRT